MMADEVAIPKTIDKIIDVAESVGGHIASRKDQSVQIKVPSASFRDAMTKIEAIGGVVNRSVSADDVSEEFHDLEVRLVNLRATRARLQEFLAKAPAIADMLTVERELERVAQEIDRSEGRLEFLRTRASMSAITVALTPKPKAELVVVTPPPSASAARQAADRRSAHPLGRRDRHRPPPLAQEVKIMKTERIAFLFALLFTAACTHGARLDTPAGFATLDQGSSDYSYRATSAKGVVLATRTEPNEVKANTEFWAETLDARLRDKGYVADGTARSVKTAKGLSGTQLRYLTSKDGRDHRYWVTVFATKSKVFVVEAAGDKEPFDRSIAAVDGAIVTLDATE